MPKWIFQKISGDQQGVSQCGYRRFQLSISHLSQKALLELQVLEWITFVSKDCSEKNLRNTPLSLDLTVLWMHFHAYSAIQLGTEGITIQLTFPWSSCPSGPNASLLLPRAANARSPPFFKSGNWFHIPGNQKSEISRETSLGITI